MVKVRNKYELTGMLIKSATGVIGGSLVLENQHPYITLAVLAIGAMANELVTYIKDK
jgi:hypothetical protein